MAGLASERKTPLFELGRDPFHERWKHTAGSPSELRSHIQETAQYLGHDTNPSISIDIMENLNLKCATLQIVDEPTDAEAWSFSSLDMDVVAMIVEFLDPLSMVRLSSTTGFLREIPLSYETVFLAMPNKLFDPTWNRLGSIIQSFKDPKREAQSSWTRVESLIIGERLTFVIRKDTGTMPFVRRNGI